jgi:hypothetical protein
MICESFLLEIVSEQIVFSSLFSPQESVLVFGGFYCAKKTGKTNSPSCCDGSLLTTHTVPCGCRERERERERERDDDDDDEEEEEPIQGTQQDLVAKE